MDIGFDLRLRRNSNRRNTNTSATPATTGPTITPTFLSWWASGDTLDPGWLVQEDRDHSGPRCVPGISNVRCI